jgi:hypothetical protein
MILHELLIAKDATECRDTIVAELRRVAEIARNNATACRSREARHRHLHSAALLERQALRLEALHIVGSAPE